MGEINLSAIPIDIALNILNIVLLFLLVRTLVYKPVRRFMDARTARVNAAAEEAAQKAADADAQKAQYEEKLASVQQECDALLADARAQAQREAQNIAASAREEAQAIVDGAKQEAAQQREDALRDLQGDVVDLAFGISEKLLERSIRDADTQKMADRLFDDCIGGEEAK